jgi:hypothetical protein
VVPRKASLYAGVLAPGAAMLDANALAQAFAEILSGDAFETVGDNVAIVTTASAIFRRFMVVFLEGQKYQRPACTIRSGAHPGK